MKRRRRGGDWNVVTGQWAGVNALATGSNSQTAVLQLVPASVSGTIVPVNNAVITEVDAQIDVYGAAVAGGYILGSGLYVSEYDTVTGTFNNQQPLLAGDAAREDWLALRVGAVSLPLNALTTTGLSWSRLSFKWKGRARIMTGQALLIAIQNSNVSTAGAGINYSAFFRAKYASVR